MAHDVDSSPLAQWAGLAMDYRMNLQQFIKDSLVQIATAVKEANTELLPIGAQANPPGQLFGRMQALRRCKYPTLITSNSMLLLLLPNRIHKKAA